MHWLCLGFLPWLLALASLSADALGESGVIPVELYQAETIVTGREADERGRGFREGIGEIVRKLTGDYSLEKSGRLAPFQDAAESFMREFSYEDRMKGIPVHDEQGTRERPFYLRMTADGAKLGSALEKAGLQIWVGRPEIEVLLVVSDARGRFLVGAEQPSADGREVLGFRLAHTHYDGYEQRELLKSAARKAGLTITLPEAEGLQTSPALQQNPVCPLNRYSTATGCIRYRGDLSAKPSGRWRMEVQAWGFSAAAGYISAPDCFHAVLDEVTYDMALRESLEAFATWARRDAKAIHCGLR